MNIEALKQLVVELRGDADFNRSWTDGRNGNPTFASPGYLERRNELATQRDMWADEVEALIISVTHLAADAPQVGGDVREALEGLVYAHEHYTECGGSHAEDMLEKALEDARGALTSPAKATEQKPMTMTKSQIIDLCASVGIEWNAPDMCDFMGDFGRVTLDGMRAIIAAAKEQQ